MPQIVNLAGLPAVRGFVIQGDTQGDAAGRTVSSAGDVNGDGYDDVIVGAPTGDDGGSDAGEAYVVFGHAGGFGRVDLTNLSAATGFVIRGDDAWDFAGFSVSTAGDVNGDGFDDLIVGAIGAGNDAGAAYVIFGHAGTFGPVDLTNMSAAAGFVIRGKPRGTGGSDFTGYSVAAAGDVNGDGFDDVVVGAPYGDDGGDDAGQAYVVFGRAGGFANIDLATLSSAQGIVIQGDASRDHAGWSVAAAGDLNRDGFADIIIGAPGGDDGGADAGEAYVVYGRAGRPGRIDLTNLSAADGFVIQGDTGGDEAGYGIASAGDVNGDGYADLVIGAPGGDDGGSAAGEAYVIFGRAGGFGRIDLTNLSTADGFVIQGDAGGNGAGFSVASAGDVNADGFDDLIVGAPNAAGFAGRAFVIFGKAGGAGRIDLTALSDTDGFVVQGAAALDQAGHGVASAGDVNGDGAADLIVGAPKNDDGGADAGAAYVVFGTLPTGSVTRTGAAGAQTIRGGGGDDTLDGRGGDDRLIGGAGDDLLSGGSGDDVLEGGAGDDTLTGGSGIDTAVMTGTRGDYIFATTAQGIRVTDRRAGSPDGSDLLDGIETVRFSDGTLSLVSASGGPAIIELSALGARGFAIQGDAAFDFAGLSLASAGDINGDGFDDIVVGAPGGRDGGRSAGEAYVIFGRAGGFGPIDLTSLAPETGFVIQGDTFDNKAGTSVASAGDINGDGFDDLVIGAPGAGTGGTAYVIFGRAGGFGRIDLTNLPTADGVALRGATAGESAGTSVASAGDVNGDGLDDMIVGAPFSDDGGTSAGRAYVIFGRAAGLADLDLRSLSQSEGFIIQGGEGDYAGNSVASLGDINGDGIDDVIVSAHMNDAGGIDAGAAYVIFGRADAPSRVELANLRPSQGFVIQGAEVNGRAGSQVASAGDINGDGFADLIVSTPLIGNSTGEAYVIFGRAGGFGRIELAALAPADGFVIRGGEPFDRAGTSVSSAGDVNGDGFDDLIVGLPGTDGGDQFNGEALVVFGRASGFGAINIANLSAVDGLRIFGAVRGEGLGSSVAAAGDVNNDGFDDFMVGAPFADQGGTSSGQSYVIFGAAPTSAVTRIGTVASQTLAGGGGDDLLDGGDGDDRLFGHGGDDRLIGGAFDDWLSGGAGSDDLSGGSGNDTLDGGTGGDAMAGGSGDDVYIVDDAGDVVTEATGGGRDEVRTALADYTLAANVELLTATAAAPTAPGSRGQRLTANALDNVVTGTAFNDTILLHLGGADTARGGAGDDGFYLGAALAPGDVIDGGEGTDQLGLQGNYSGLTIGAAMLTGIELLVLLSGADTRFGDTSGRFYSYDLATVDAAVPAGYRLTLSFNMLRAGENVAFDGSSESDGSFLTYGGFGNDGLIGGQKDDGFFFGGGRWGAGDRVDGQGGSLDQLGLQGDYSGANAVTFGANQIAGIELIVLLSGADARFGGAGSGYSYDLTMSDGNVGAGATLVVSANRLVAGEVLRFDAAAEANGSYRVFSGGGDDAIRGGGGGDELWGGAGDDRLTGGGGADTLYGGAGSDVFAYLTAADSTVATRDRIQDFATGDRIDLSAFDVDAVAAGRQGFSFIGPAAFSGAGGELRVYSDGDGWLVDADIDGDRIADLSIALAAPPTQNWSVADFIL